MGHGKNPPIKKRKHSSALPRIPFAEMRFARIELLEPEKQEFRTLLESGEFEHVSVDDFTAEGYKVSFSEDKRGGGTICTLSTSDPEHPNGGLNLTGRGRDSAAALSVAYYKHHYLCEDGLWREAETRRGGSYDDIG